jgi:low temperature requirement protein LtrA
MQQQWWQRPQLRTDTEEGRERKVSWLELFYDLVFVVAIAEVSHYLAGHLSLEGLLGYILLFVAVWWIWISGTFYNERFETYDVSYRVFTFLQMIPLAALAIFAHDGLGKLAEEFALAYVAARLIIIVLWVRGGWHVPSMRPVTNRYTIGFMISVLLFVISTAVPPPLRFVLWALGLLSDLVTPMTTLHIQARLPRYSFSKLPERFGLFVLIVLGEAIVGVVQGVAEHETLTPTTGVAGVLGMGLIFGIWWIYFDFVARRPRRIGSWWVVGWAYLHLPLVMSIAALSAGLLNLLTLEEPAGGQGTYWLLAGSVALALITVGLLELTLRREDDEPASTRVSVPLKIGAGLLALALGPFGGALGPIAMLATFLPLVLVQMLYGAYVWFRHPEHLTAEHLASEA